MLKYSMRFTQLWKVNTPKRGLDTNANIQHEVYPVVEGEHTQTWT
jgi:hypothetical protein